jgi:hypothetical protein
METAVTDSGYKFPIRGNHKPFNRLILTLASSFASPRAATSAFNALYTSPKSLAAQHPFGLSSARRLMQTKG